MFPAADPLKSCLCHPDRYRSLPQGISSALRPGPSAARAAGAKFCCSAHLRAGFTPSSSNSMPDIDSGCACDKFLQGGHVFLFLFFVTFGIIRLVRLAVFRLGNSVGDAAAIRSLIGQQEFRHVQDIVGVTSLSTPGSVISITSCLCSHSRSSAEIFKSSMNFSRDGGPSRSSTSLMISS